MERVQICEMSPRDGLQFLGSPSAGTFRRIPLDKKIELVHALQRAGLPYIEVGAFVSRRRTPQLADTEELCAGLQHRGGQQLAALVPNLHHYERFEGSGLDTVALFVSASERYSLINTGATIEQAMENAGQVAEAARRDGARLRAHVSGAFHELGEDETANSDLGVVVRLCQELLELGCDCVSLADTGGATNPTRVHEVLSEVKRAVGLGAVAVHLHDGYGAGLANALAAYQAGVRIFDASVGGIGGTHTRSDPDRADHITPGNIATEELAEMFRRMNLPTGVDTDSLLAAGRVVFEITRLTGDAAPPGRFLRARLGYAVHWKPPDGIDVAEH